jgi:hypothetical protein
MPAPDYRIRFPSTLVDFAQDVGTTGQEHDSYPAPGQQARYDHIRLYLLGLLSNQSSNSAPVNYREGTIWNDISDSTLGPTLKIRRNNKWESLSKSVLVNPELSLDQWYHEASMALTSLAPELFFSGVVVSNAVSDIPIPARFIRHIYEDTRAFVTINGSADKLSTVEGQNLNTLLRYRPMIIDPRNVTVVAGTLIRLMNLDLEKGDTFMVSLRRIPTDTFFLENQQV